jgi:hypothetical protein
MPNQPHDESRCRKTLDSSPRQRPILATGFPPQEVSLTRITSLAQECPEWEVQLLNRLDLDRSRGGFLLGLPSKPPTERVQRSRFDKITEEIVTSSNLEFQHEANVPGAAGVIRCHGGAGFYCTVHKHEIQPLMFEIEDGEIPCCEECMLEEMVAEGREVKTPVAADPVAAAVGDHDIAEDAIWECMT